MNAQALLCDAQQQFSLREVVLPEPGPQHVVVHTLYTGVSVGTEFALIRGKLNWGPYPLCTGYQGVGVIERAGADVQGFKVGDRVYFRDNRTIALPDGQKVSGVSGTHCSHAVIEVGKTHGLALLPAGVDEAAASLFVLAAVGLYGVDLASPRMGQTVLVHGAGMIGLASVAALSHRGCRVISVDLDDQRLALARKLGADETINAAREDLKQAAARLCPNGADVVFESTGIPACLDPAISLCKWKGVFVWQGNYGQAPVSLHFLPAHGKQLTMYFPCDDGMAPCRTAVLKNMAKGVLPWQETITHRVPAAEAPALYTAINHGPVAGLIGAVIRWA